MSSILSILRRIGGTKAPPITGSAGELAIYKAGTAPTDATSLYAHDGTQWLEVLDTRGKTMSVPVFTDATTAPASPRFGDFWLNTGTNLLSIWDGATWLSTDPHPVATGTAAPTAPTSGALWLDPVKKELQVWDGTRWAHVAFTNVQNTFIQPQLIDVTSTSAALHIKQLGTGDCLRIEDETNPDASPFVVDQNGNVGIGGGASTFKVSVATQGTANFSGFYINGPAAANDEAGLLRVVTSNQTATNVVAMFGTTTSKILTVASDGMVLVSGPGKFGYGTSAGGAVVQTGSKSTMVPLDRVSGRVAMHAEVMNTNQVVNFGIINNKIAAEDVVIVNISGGVGNGAIYNLQVNNVAAGAVYLRLVCTSPGPIGEPVQFNFVVIKGSHN